MKWTLRELVIVMMASATIACGVTNLACLAPAAAQVKEAHGVIDLNVVNTKIEKLINVATKQNIRIQALEAKVVKLEADLQKTRDQTAHIAIMLRKTIKSASNDDNAPAYGPAAGEAKE
jgi:predicted  nucleic acid-binding Zn-ribbon protein